MVRDVDKVPDLRRVHLLVLAGDQHGGHAHQLELLGADHRRLDLEGKSIHCFFLKKKGSNWTGNRCELYLQEPVYAGYGEVERLLQQVELLVHLHKPVDQHVAHLGADRH